MDFENEWDILLNTSNDLLTSEARGKQFFTIYMNSKLLSMDGKNEVGKIPTLGMQISTYIKENNIDIIGLINNNSEFTIQQKKILLNFIQDFDFLFPVGGSFFRLDKFPRFDKKTRESIKIWIAMLSLVGGGVLGVQQFLINANDIEEKKIKLEVLKNEDELNEIEKEKKLLELELLELEILKQHKMMVDTYGDPTKMPPAK